MVIIPLLSFILVVPILVPAVLFLVPWSPLSLSFLSLSASFSLLFPPRPVIAAPSHHLQCPPREQLLAAVGVWQVGAGGGRHHLRLAVRPRQWANLSPLSPLSALILASRRPDPLSTLRADTRSSGTDVGLLSWRCLVVIEPKDKIKTIVS